VVASLRPGQSLEHLLTDEDHVAMQASMVAAARGDALTAWEQTMSGLVVEEALCHHQLRELALLGEDAPAWMFSRWAVDQAYRWMLLEQDPRTDLAVLETLGAGHWDHVQAIKHDPLELKEYGTLVAASDWMCQQLATYEVGGLADFLDVRAEQGLLDKCDRIRDWAASPMGVFLLDRCDAGVLRVRDVVRDESVDVLNLGAGADRGLGAHVLGRLVPISVGPRRMFDLRPVSIDAETAEVAAGLIRSGDELGWIEAVGRGRDEGRLARGFSCGGATLYSSDIVPERRA